MVSPRGRSAEIEEMLTIAPPFAVFDHRRDRVFREQEHALDIDLHDLAILLRLLVDHAAAAADADIVVEEIEPAELIDGGVDQLPAIVLVGDVAGDRGRRAAFVPDHLDGAFGELEIAVGDHHFRAGPRQQDRRRAAIADAVACRAAAGDQRDLAGEASVFLGSLHAFLPCCGRTIATGVRGEKGGGSTAALRAFRGVVYRRYAK